MLRTIRVSPVRISVIAAMIITLLLADLLIGSAPAVRAEAGTARKARKA